MKSGCAVACLFWAASAWADSPLTSTDIAKHYDDVPAVRAAKRSHSAAGDVLAFLLNGQAPLDQRVAVVNALGWEFSGKDNARLLLEGLAAAKKIPKLRLTDLGADEALLLGYMRGLDDYFKMSAIERGAAGVRGTPARKLTAYAAQKSPGDFTVQIIAALLEAQAGMDGPWCRVFRVIDDVMQRFPAGAGTQNMRPRAVGEILEYIGLYAEDCPRRASAGPDPELNQIYEVARLGDRIVVAAQAGIVIWDPEKRTHETHEHELCVHVTVWKGEAWFGCRDGLFRYDGKKLVRVLAHGGGENEPVPRVGPRGELYVLHGKRLMQWQPSRRLERVRRFPLAYYDIAFAPDGSTWGINFLRNLVRIRDGRTEEIALRSEVYPGRDPRSFYVDRQQRLWVIDFESGFFRLNESTGRFERVAGVESQASAVGVDMKRQRVWLLHYRKGLHLHPAEGAAQVFDLSRLDTMRTMLVDDDGSVWIGGWGALVHMTETDRGWQFSDYVVR